MKQFFKNFPEELLKQKRFFKVRENKAPFTNDWGNPNNQKFYNEVEGIAGFDISGHGIAPDYVILDLDHVINPKTGEWVNNFAKDTFCSIINLVPTYIERSISKSGFHIVYKLSEGKFDTITNSSKNNIYFVEGDNKSKIEIFYKTKARYFLFTGDIYNCEPQTPIANGDIVIQKLFELKNKQNNKATQQYKENDSDYDKTRAIRMLDFIDPSIDYTDWLNVGMALKNIGCSVSDWDMWSSKSEKYKSDECTKKWQSFNRSGLNIATIHDLAKNGGYNEKEFKKEYYKNIEVKPQPIKQTEKTENKYQYEAPDILNHFLKETKEELEEVKKIAPATLTDYLIKKFLKSDLTDLDCAELFCKVYKQYRFNYDTQSWFKYDDCKWIEEKDDKSLRNKWNPIAKWASLQAEINYKTMVFEEEMKIKLHSTASIKHARKVLNDTIALKNLRKKKNIIDTVSEFDDIYIGDKDFNSNKYLFNTQNNTIDLNTFHVLAHNPMDYCTMSANVAIDDFSTTSGALKRCKEWDNFIKFAIPNPKTRLLVQKYMGYAMSGLTNLKIFLFLYGKQANTGKTTFIETMNNIFGDYAKTFPIEYLAANKKELTGNEPEPILYRMRHCRLITSSETKENQKLDTAKIKRFTGGDTLCPRTLNKENIEFTPQFKILMGGNFMPKVDNIYDSGLRTRLRIIPFNNVPDKKNSHLKEIFDKPENKTAILNWIIEGAVAVMEDIKNGINPFDIENLPEEMKKELEKFYNGNDNIPTFIEDSNYKFGENKNIKFVDIWHNYLAWCKINEERRLRRSDFENNLLVRYKNKGVKLINHSDQHEAKILEGIGKAA